MIRVTSCSASHTNSRNVFGGRGGIVLEPNTSRRCSKSPLSPLKPINIKRHVTFSSILDWFMEIPLFYNFHCTIFEIASYNYWLKLETKLHLRTVNCIIETTENSYGSITKGGFSIYVPLNERIRSPFSSKKHIVKAQRPWNSLPSYHHEI